jgi:hypothetical protein
MIHTQTIVETKNPRYEMRSIGISSTYRDTDTVDAEITETQDARTVGDDADLRVLAGPVLQHGADGLALLDGDVQSLGAGVQGGVLQADVTDGGGVDERHELPDVIHQQAVEQVDVGVLEARQVHVLVDVGLACVDDAHGPGALGLKALHGVREEAGEVLADAFFGSEGETLVPQRLAQDLVSRSLGLGNVLGGAILVDLGVVVLGIATELVEVGGLHGLLNSGDVDGRERVEVGHPSAGDGHALSTDARMRRATREDGRGGGS